jgi:hypothetical protein
MTDEGIAIEYEADLAFKGEPLKTCPKCKTQTHASGCPVCKTEDGAPIALTGDPTIDNVVAMIEGNEVIEDLEALLRGGFGFEPVPRKEAR